MATSEEPISLVISMVQSLAWSCELPAREVSSAVPSFSPGLTQFPETIP